MYWWLSAHNLKPNLVCNMANSARYLLVCIHNGWHAQENPADSRGNKLQIMTYANTQLGWNVIKHAVCLLYRTGLDRQPAISSRISFLVPIWRIYITVFVTNKISLQSFLQFWTWHSFLPLFAVFLNLCTRNLHRQTFREVALSVQVSSREFGTESLS